MIQLILLVTQAAFAATSMYDGKSFAHVTQSADGVVSVKSVDTHFEFVDPLLDSGRKYVLLQSKTDSTYTPGREKAEVRIELKAFEPLTRKELWTISEAADSYRTYASHFFLATTLAGCCGAIDSRRAYSLSSGRLLFPYSFVSRFGRPLVLRAANLDPAKHRLVGFQGNYWTGRDRSTFRDPDGKLAVGGVLSYASTDKLIQKVAILYDEKAANDPSEEPSSITVVYKGKEWAFGPETRSDVVEYWDDAIKRMNESERIFNGLVLRLRFGKTEVVEIPIVHDRLDLGHFKGSRLYPKAVAIE